MKKGDLVLAHGRVAVVVKDFYNGKARVRVGNTVYVALDVKPLDLVMVDRGAV